MIATNKFVLTHVPRCGGTWIRETLQNGGLLEPATFLKSHSFCPSNAIKNRMLFCFVRHPASWYVSYWNRRMCYGWGNCPFDSYKADNVNEFVKNVLKAEKDYFSRMIKKYIEETTYVGKFENLINELIKMLEMSNSAYDEKVLKNTKPINCSDYEKYAGIYEKDVLEQIQEVEAYIIDKYYKDSDLPTYFVKNRN